ncbi:MAG: DUF445 family protein [Gemmatimonadetes bacterium]|nr:DUF445 family protein [Gemmatimonadota bacterium]
MSPELLRALITVAFGALAGGVTNTIAIWMLFHPYEPPRLGRWRIGFLQGAVPKNQARLAAAIGRTVGGKLLTDEDLARIFTEPAFRGAFDERLAAFLDEVLHRERGSLREMLPDGMGSAAEGFVDDMLGHALARLHAYLKSERFEASVGRRADELVAAVRDEPVGGVLTPAREAAIAQAVDDWLEGAVASDDFRRTVEDYLERASHRLLEPERTFEEILPLGLVGSLEHAIQAYLPLAIERLGALLEDPDTRARFESTLHDLFHRFLRDLRFHQRVVARLVVTEDTVDRVLDTIEKEGAQRLSELLQEPGVQEAMSRGINDAVVDFLRRPVRSVLGEPESSNVLEARATVADWVVGAARDPQTRAFLVEKLDLALQKAGARTWGDVMERVPTEKVAAGMVKVARSDAAARLYREVGERVSGALLDRPIGVPARYLPDDAPERLERGLASPLWIWLQEQVPTVVERIDVARRVEDKVLEYPTPKLEELVRRVTERELRLIVRLGYVLGAMIGLALVAVDWLIGA